MRITLCLIGLLFFSSCIKERLDNCIVRLAFSWEDACGNEVISDNLTGIVHVTAYNESGTLVYSDVRDMQEIIENNNSIDITLYVGKHTFVVWSGDQLLDTSVLTLNQSQLSDYYLSDYYNGQATQPKILYVNNTPDINLDDVTINPVDIHLVQKTKNINLKLDGFSDESSLTLRIRGINGDFLNTGMYIPSLTSQYETQISAGDSTLNFPVLWPFPNTNDDTIEIIDSDGGVLFSESLKSMLDSYHVAQGVTCLNSYDITLTYEPNSLGSVFTLSINGWNYLVSNVEL